ncbi:acylphosphatase [Hamadaea sp. NPDC051192]|uniref:acylphosphatase n=1 Tax=Hamadaea sp. NPDC051192 TaxID=3154940 RepID=UPI00342652D9
MSEIIRRRVVVAGLVQGVYFRDTCRRKALAHNVAGWVRNRRDGAVEAAFEGAPDDVDRLLRWARRGPEDAVVKTFTVEEEDPVGDTGFLILPTA